MNNTIASNIAGDSGGGICRGPSGRPFIINCIIWGNGDDLSGCSATYCCIEDLEKGEGNIQNAPMFVTGPLGEYYLHPLSPCIDAGSQPAADADLDSKTTQTDGKPETGTVDMGRHYPVTEDDDRGSDL